MSARRTVVVAGARTPMGRYGGALSAWSVTELGAHAIAAALARAGIDADAVQRVVMGHVLQAGAGQNSARQAAIGAGVPMDVPALTINSVCLSGTAAVAYGDLLIRSGECDVVVAGGMESMSTAPHLLAGARSGLGYGRQLLLDVTQHDGLTDALSHLGMGEATEADTRAAGWSRGDLDAFAADSHRKADAAATDGRIATEIAPLARTGRKGETIAVTADEGIRPGTTAESLARLRPAFAADGLLTAATSSPISDGAAALVLMSEDRAEELGLTPLARLGACASVAGPGTSLLRQPASAIARASAMEGIAVGDLDRLEINEAFASVVLESVRALGVDLDRVNPMGGAIALGHPLGMSGARLVLSLAHAVGSGRAHTAVAALCGGGGQGDAVVVRAL